MAEAPKKLVFGVGYNDADYAVYKKQPDGKYLLCPFYKTWKKMLERAFYERYHAVQPTYKDVKVCEEWLTFSNFKAWMEKQDWQGRQLDKDLLGNGKLYSPDTCCFLTRKSNNFMKTCPKQRGVNPVGVQRTESGRYYGTVSNPFTGKCIYLGLRSCSTAAHIDWRKAKQEIAVKLAELETDERAKAALVKFVSGVPYETSVS